MIVSAGETQPRPSPAAAGALRQAARASFEGGLIRRASIGGTQGAVAPGGTRAANRDDAPQGRWYPRWYPAARSTSVSTGRPSASAAASPSRPQPVAPTVPSPVTTT